MKISKNFTKSLVGILSSVVLLSSMSGCFRPSPTTIDVEAKTQAFAVVPGENKIAVLDPDTNQVAKYLDTDVRPSSIAVSPDGKMILATNEGSGTVSVFLRRANGAFEKLSPVGSGNKPASIVFNPKQSEAYVSYEGDGKIMVLDTKNAQKGILRTAGVVNLQGSAPKKMVMDSSGTRLFVIDGNTAKLLVLTKSGNTLIRKTSEIPLVQNSVVGTSSASSIEGITITSQDRVYVSNYTRDEVLVIDGKSPTAVLQTLNLRNGGGNLAINATIGPKNMTVYKNSSMEKVYVAGYNASIVSSIDTRTNKITNVALTGSTGFQGNSNRDSYNPVGVAVVTSNGSDYIYATNSAGLGLSLIDPLTDRLKRNTSHAESLGEQKVLGEIVSVGAIKD
ncbi:MAG: YncE family protein [Candidatus Sericytochromatia bacterium]